MNNYKEKYNKALRKALDLYNQGLINPPLEHIFPELKESEDERIRKGLIKILNEIVINTNYKELGIDYNIRDMITWLEEQNPAWSEKDKNLLNRLIGVLDGTNKEDYHEGWEEKFLPWLKTFKERMQPKQCEHLENFDNEEDYGIDGLYHAIDILEKTIGRVGGYQSDDGILEHKAAINAVKELYEKQGEKNINHIDIKEKAHQIAWETSKDYDPSLSKESWCEMAALDMASWLEKQDEKSINIDIESMVSSYEQRLKSQGSIKNSPLVNMCLTAFRHGIENTLEELNFKHLEKQGENKPTDKVEPKFKVDDWVILNDIVAQILDKQKYGFVGLDTDGKDFFCNYGHTDSMRLWTIADAKDGDVLVAQSEKGSESNEQIFLFKAINSRDYVDNCIEYYCRLCGGVFYKNTLGYMGTTLDIFYPATKEQRDLLFQKMEEAGYEWDSEKKELKKVESKTLNANKVIEWLNENVADFWANPCSPKNVINQFKKDFGL